MNFQSKSHQAILFTRCFTVSLLLWSQLNRKANKNTDILARINGFICEMRQLDRSDCNTQPTKATVEPWKRETHFSTRITKQLASEFESFVYVCVRVEQKRFDKTQSDENKQSNTRMMSRSFIFHFFHGEYYTVISIEWMMKFKQPTDEFLLCSPCRADGVIV